MHLCCCVAITTTHPSPPLSHLPTGNLSPPLLCKSLATSTLPSVSANSLLWVPQVSGARKYLSVLSGSCHSAPCLRESPVSPCIRVSLFLKAVYHSIVSLWLCSSQVAVSDPSNCAMGRRRAPAEHTAPPLLSSWVPGQRVQTLFSRLCYFCWDGSSFSQDRLELLPVQYPWMLLVVRQESVSCPSRNVLHYQVSQIGKTKRTKARAFPSALSESARLL